MRGYVSEIWGWDQQWQESDFSAHFDPKGITLAHKEHEWLDIPMSKIGVGSYS
jgi:hypothetical protein